MNRVLAPALLTAPGGAHSGAAGGESFVSHRVGLRDEPIQPRGADLADALRRQRHAPRLSVAAASLSRPRPRSPGREPPLRPAGSRPWRPAGLASRAAALSLRPLPFRTVRIHRSGGTGFRFDHIPLPLSRMRQEIRQDGIPVPGARIRRLRVDIYEAVVRWSLGAGKSRRSPGTRTASSTDARRSQLQSGGTTLR